MSRTTSALIENLKDNAVASNERKNVAANGYSVGGLAAGYHHRHNRLLRQRYSNRPVQT